MCVCVRLHSRTLPSISFTTGEAVPICLRLHIHCEQPLNLAPLYFPLYFFFCYLPRCFTFDRGVPILFCCVFFLSPHCNQVQHTVRSNRSSRQRNPPYFLHRLASSLLARAIVCAPQSGPLTLETSGPRDPSREQCLPQYLSTCPKGGACDRFLR